MLDITSIEKAWEDYQNNDMFNDIGKLNLVAWMGERMGHVLQEIQTLRMQVETLQRILTEVEGGHLHETAWWKEQWG